MARLAAVRRTILPGLCALACVPVAAMWLDRDPTKVLSLSILAALVIVAHRKNVFEEFSPGAARRPLDPKPDQTRS